MRSNALRKEEHFEEPQESWENFRARIAEQSEEASNLPGNNNGPDMEAFASKYRLRKSSLA